MIQAMGRVLGVPSWITLQADEADLQFSCLTFAGPGHDPLAGSLQSGWRDLDGADLEGLRLDAQMDPAPHATIVGPVFPALSCTFASILTPLESIKRCRPAGCGR